MSHGEIENTTISGVPRTNLRLPFIGHIVPFILKSVPFIGPFVGRTQPPGRRVDFQRNLPLGGGPAAVQDSMVRGTGTVSTVAGARLSYSGHPVLPRAGFTLVELVVTLAVVAILVTLAQPGMSRFIKDQRQKDQVTDLIDDLSVLQVEAIKRSAPVTLCKSNNPLADPPKCDTSTGNPWSNGWVIFVDGDSGSPTNDANGKIDNGEEILIVREALSGDKNELYGDGELEGTANRITADSFGMLGFATIDGDGNPVDDREFFHCDERGAKYAYAVTVNRAGRVHLSEQGKDMAGNALADASCPTL